jgi:hypothetical protein
MAVPLVVNWRAGPRQARLLFVRVVRSVISAGFARLRNGATSTVRRGSSDREVLVGQDDDSAPVQMFCGDCGSKTVEGDHFCRVCGPGQLPASALNPDAAVAQEEPKPAPEELPMAGAVQSAPSLKAVSPIVLHGQPVEKPLYCNHNASERATRGAETQYGSETCTDCRLPYAPASPGPRLRPAVSPTAARQNWFIRHMISTIITAVAAVIASNLVLTVGKVAAKGNELKGSQ